MSNQFESLPVKQDVERQLDRARRATVSLGSAIQTLQRSAFLLSRYGSSMAMARAITQTVAILDELHKESFRRIDELEARNTGL